MPPFKAYLRKKVLVSRIDLIDPSMARGRTTKLFALVERRFGRVPNAMRVLASSPAAFEAWWSFDTAMRSAALSPAVQERIAVRVAEVNECGYCLSAHTAAGLALGLSEDDLLDARRGSARDPHANAALEFTTEVVATRGDVTDLALARAREEGLSDAELVEIVAVVAINIFNNYYNRLARPVIDFAPVQDVPATVTPDASRR